MASLPYESATSGDKALGDLQKILRAFGQLLLANGRTVLEHVEQSKLLALAAPQ